MTIESIKTPTIIHTKDSQEVLLIILEKDKIFI